MITWGTVQHGSLPWWLVVSPRGHIPLPVHPNITSGRRIRLAALVVAECMRVWVTQEQNKTYFMQISIFGVNLCSYKTILGDVQAKMRSRAQIKVESDSSQWTVSSSSFYFFFIYNHLETSLKVIIGSILCASIATVPCLSDVLPKAAWDSISSVSCK